MTIYLKRKEDLLKTYHQLSKTYNFMSLVRLLVAMVFLFIIYYVFKTKSLLLIFLGSVDLVVFFILMKFHGKIASKRGFVKELIAINTDEITYLNKEGIPFDNGADYVDLKHFYTHDLDIFGTNSLFHNLNRTATYIGKKTLALQLQTQLKNEDILLNQNAIQELSSKIHWRQNILAFAKTIKDNESHYQKLIEWANKKPKSLSKTLQIISFMTPTLFVVLVFIYIVTQNPLFKYLASTLFLVNLVLLLTQFNKIKEVLLKSDKIVETLQQYALIIQELENEAFISPKLNQLKQSLVYKAQPASLQIKQLAVLASKIQSIQNGLAAFLLNGIFLYHLHVLKRVLSWQHEYAKQIPIWLNIIGEVEALNSLANFSYNNPEFVFPTLNNSQGFVFENLGHPLIAPNKRVCNNITIHANGFIILSGSNMSGKSTFLRTLGINMILAGVGSAICASKASIDPLPVLVSMRQTDSLHDSTSYFFAEVSRLKQIMNRLQTETCFVLLDEILKGTNSDDKQIGTIEVIKKIIAMKGLGSIATHDLKVCVTSNYEPNTVVNKCFEVEIVDNELVFDYTLKEGVCKNKSATFLMKKMGVI